VGEGLPGSAALIKFFYRHMRMNKPTRSSTP